MLDDEDAPGSGGNDPPPGEPLPNDPEPPEPAPSEPENPDLPHPETSDPEPPDPEEPPAPTPRRLRKPRKPRAPKGPPTPDPEPPKSLDDILREAISGPKTVTVDGQTVTSHDLKQLIDADRYLASKQARPTLRFTKMVPPGAV